MGPNILITGVSSGIGLGLAKELLRRGATVLGISRRTPAELLAHPRFVFRECDLSQLELIPAVIHELVSPGNLSDQGGDPRLNLAILNAGVLGKLQDMRDASLDELQQTMTINLWSNKVLIDELLRSQPGISQIVTISSGASQSGHRGWNGYCISKAALNMLTLLYARENPQVHFTALAPGIIDTEIQAAIRELPSRDEVPTIAYLKSLHHTAQMPDADQAASRILRVIEALPEHAESGDYVDVRQFQPA